MPSDNLQADAPSRATVLTMRWPRGLLRLGLMLLPLTAIAQTPSHAPHNTPHTKTIEGAVARVDSNEILLTVKGGTTETYQLAPNVQIARSRPGRMSDLVRGSQVGCTSVYTQGTTALAGECHIFADHILDVAEGHGNTDSADRDTITGSITDIRDADPVQGQGKRLLVQITHQGIATTMTVSDLTHITVIATADASALKPGVRMRGLSQQAADGTGVIQLLTVRQNSPGK